MVARIVATLLFVMLVGVGCAEEKQPPTSFNYQCSFTYPKHPSNTPAVNPTEAFCAAARDRAACLWLVQRGETRNATPNLVVYFDDTLCDMAAAMFCDPNYVNNIRNSLGPSYGLGEQWFAPLWLFPEFAYMPDGKLSDENRKLIMDQIRRWKTDCTRVVAVMNVGSGYKKTLVKTYTLSKEQFSPDDLTFRLYSLPDQMEPVRGGSLPEGVEPIGVSEGVGWWIGEEQKEIVKVETVTENGVSYRQTTYHTRKDQYAPVALCFPRSRLSQGCVFFSATKANNERYMCLWSMKAE